jgi:hypothetical protein
MGRKRNERSNSSEQTDSRDERDNQSAPMLSENGMEAGRAERTPSEGTQGDQRSGDEGVDDPALSRMHRDDMSTTPAQGDGLDSGQSSGQRDESQRSQRTQQRANDERFDDASGFSGQGGQKEGEFEEAEGTGYTEE